MAKRPDETSDRNGADEEPNGRSASADPTRHERLTTLREQCKTARAEAESLGERLLTYLLAMAGEEAQAAMDRTRDPVSPPR